MPDKKLGIPHKRVFPTFTRHRNATQPKLLSSHNLLSDDLSNTLLSPWNTHSLKHIEIQSKRCRRAPPNICLRRQTSFTQFDPLNPPHAPTTQQRIHKMSSSDQTINIPQLILILFLGGLAIRYFFFSSSSSASGNRNGSSANNLRAREADVERIQQMFPQVSRRNIMWDLQRNGGNVVATTERILSGRGLEVVSLACHFVT